MNLKIVDITNATVRLGYFSYHFWRFAYGLALFVAYMSLLFVCIDISTVEPIFSTILPIVPLFAAFIGFRRLAQILGDPWPRVFQFNIWDAPGRVIGLDAVAALSTLRRYSRWSSRWRYLLTPRQPLLVIAFGAAAICVLLGTLWALGILIPFNRPASTVIKFVTKVPFLREIVGIAIFGIPAALAYFAYLWLAADASKIVNAEPGTYYVLLRAFHRDQFFLEEREIGSLWVATDRTRLEDVVARALKKHVPLVALGDPGESVPETGANRSYVARDSWQARVSEWLARAGGAIILLGGGPSLQWEIAQVSEAGLLHKSIFIFPESEALARGLAEIAAVTTQGLETEVLRNLPTERNALAIVIPSKDQATLFVSKTKFQSDYELASRLALASLLVSHSSSDQNSIDGQQAVLTTQDQDRAA